MGWEDRPYYRDRGYRSNPLSALLSGSVPLFTAFGIRVRAHSALILFVLCELLLDWTAGYGLPSRLASMAVLSVVALLHEFGRCWAAHAVGGEATDILLWPLGGLTFPDTPQRPGAKFLAVAAGPMVNALICLGAGLALYLLHRSPPLNPFHPLPAPELGWRAAAFYFWWLFVVSYILLLLNLLPIYPLDGGQMAQAALWKFVGPYNSRLACCIVGMVGSALLGAYGLWRWDGTTLLFLLLATMLFYSCQQERMMLREIGPGEPWQAGETDFSASLYAQEQTKRRRISKKAVRIARKRARQEAAARQRLDAILAKVSAKGISSLGWRERRTLRRATEERRRREMEMRDLLD